MRYAVLALGVVTLMFSTSYASRPVKGAKSRLYLPKKQLVTNIHGDDVMYYQPYARGKRGRKYIRRFSLRANLTGEKQQALEEYGYTPHRLRVRSMGRITERWRYYSIGLELWFDEHGKIIDRRHFQPEEGHID